MGLCAIELNKEEQEREHSGSRAIQSDVYAEKLGYGLPNYVRSHRQQTLKRLILAPRGDQITQMETNMRDFELAKVEEAKKQFMEAYKKHNADAVDKMSKSAAKKHERTTLLNWQHTNSVLG